MSKPITTITKAYAATTRWANEKGFMETTTADIQWNKMVEEASELLYALTNGTQAEVKDAIGDVLVTMFIRRKLLNTRVGQLQNMIGAQNETKTDCITDAIELLQHVLIIQHSDVHAIETIVMQDMYRILDGIAKYYGTTVLACWKLAYAEISKRKGKVVNGVFIKD